MAKAKIKKPVKTAKKSAAPKKVVKKAAIKKAPAKKVVAKKVVAKKVVAKKVVAKKVVAKKVVAKKVVAKKVVAKKVVAKKVVAKKVVAKKVVAKKVAVKKVVAKKVIAKKAIAMKPVKKAEVKVVVKKVAAKKAPKERLPHKVAEKISQKPVAKKVKLFKKNSKTRYTAKELLHFKKVLLEEKERIIASARANMRTLVDSESGDYVGDDSSYASHMAEQGSDEMEREKNYMFVQRDEKYLGYIEEALTRVDQGTYGLCIDCIDEPKNLCATCPLIPRERLEIVPITQHCIECKNIRG
ncbi:MAG: histone H1-like repetitive region-containing protein [Ignavibacteriae bacterium]|nr:histone H1-like repetitive region-containing protein [Ignavibacteriota bacterium]